MFLLIIIIKVSFFLYQLGKIFLLLLKIEFSKFYSLKILFFCWVVFSLAFPSTTIPLYFFITSNGKLQNHQQENEKIGKRKGENPHFYYTAESLYGWTPFPCFIFRIFPSIFILLLLLQTSSSSSCTVSLSFCGKIKYNFS